jgi:hypothetical protein
MSDEVPEEVAAGFRAYADNGQCLEVTDQCAVGMHGKLYHTARWKREFDANKAAWEARSWWRRALGMAPKGYWQTHTRGAAFLDGILGPWFA